MSIKLIGIIIASSCVTSTPSIAFSATGSMSVMATVESSCSLGTSAAINLGSREQASGETSTGKKGTTLSVACNNGANWTMFSTQSLTKALKERQLTSKATSLNETTYALIADTAKNLPLPPANSTSVLTGIGTGTLQTFLIPPKAVSELNAYSDTYQKIINLTLVY